MSVLKKEDFFARIKEKVGDDTSDEAISFLEDMTDTYTALETSTDSTEWKEKYEELDKEWRKKYTERFFDSGVTPEENVIDDGEDRTFEELFEEREG